MKAWPIPLVGLMIVLLTFQAPHASKPPAAESVPTGCSFDGSGVAIEASREWGVVPFRATFSVEVVGVDDTVDVVYWSFGDDDPVGSAGTTVAHRFNEPLDHEVIAHVVTRNRGVLEARVTVSGYRAVLSLVFDDGHATVLSEAVPLLQSYGVTATAYIVTSWTSISPLIYMTWEDIAAVQAAGWDIGSHSIHHPRLSEVDPFDLMYEIRQSQIELRARGFPATSFSLPYQDYDQEVLDAVKEYYESCKTDTGLNPGIDGADPFMIKSYTSHHWYSFDYYRAHIDSVIGTSGWYVINNHIMRDPCEGESWCVSAERIAEVIEYAQANRVKVANIAEVMENRRAGFAVSEEGISAGAPSRQPPGLLSVPPHISYAPADIRYYVSAPADVEIGVYDVTGRRVKSLLRRVEGAGERSVSWDGRNSSGVPVSSGCYFVVLRVNGDIGATDRILVLR